ncbi:site-2 protease family protein [Jidongwangia harbinensis]|uniref:site-2 protease family protein n=1 Tax=Jidongwangia harbinensis TaxID=2878561 RepID=UPI001CD9830E|nr:site-2 protease family protein [Jidongwangia harbinensis]MCA2219182.1 site-2 protease family protein [Jidongwangia harbinensis]
MRQSVRLGRVAGVPVGVHWSVLVVLVLLVQALAAAFLPAGAPGHRTPAYWLAAVAIAGLFLLGLLVHELAHALTARHYGIRAEAITLWALGGVSELDDEPPHPRAALLIAVSGPAASAGAAALFAAGGLLAGLVDGLGLLRVGLLWLALVNAVTAVFNLLPGAPLDGGRVVAAVVWRWRGDRARGVRAAGRAGMWVGGALTAVGFTAVLLTGSLSGVWVALVGWFLTVSARAETTRVRLGTAFTGLRVGDLMTAPAVCGYSGQSVAAFVSGVAARHPHRAYPVIDLDGRFAGLVLLGRLAALAPPRRAGTRLADVLVRPADVPVAGPDTPLTEAVPMAAGPHRIAVVVRDGRPCGVLSSGDVRRALQIVELGGRPHRHPAGAELPSPG